MDKQIIKKDTQDNVIFLQDFKDAKKRHKEDVCKQKLIDKAIIHSKELIKSEDE